MSQRRPSAVVVAVAIAGILTLGHPSAALAACTPNRSALASTYVAGKQATSNPGVIYYHLRAELELQNPYVYAGTTHHYIGLSDTASQGVANMGFKKSAGDSRMMGYVYLRDKTGAVSTATFDPLNYDANGRVFLEIAHTNGTTYDWVFYAGGTVVHGAAVFSDFNTNYSQMKGSIANRRSQMPGGTSDHTAFVNPTYTSQYGTASWGGNVVNSNTSWFGATTSPFEIWDKYCAT